MPWIFLKFYAITGFSKWVMTAPSLTTLLVGGPSAMGSVRLLHIQEAEFWHQAGSKYQCRAQEEQLDFHYSMILLAEYKQQKNNKVN